MSETLLLAKEVAERLNMKVAGVYRETRLGRLPTVRIGRSYRYSPRLLEEFIQSGGSVRPEDGR